MKEAMNGTVGVTFLCPECRTWTNYHQPTAAPIQRLQILPLALVVKCEDCGSESKIPLDWAEA